MASILEAHLALMEKELRSKDSNAEDQAQRVEDLIAIHIGIFAALEGHIGENGLTEAQLPLLPLFQRWLQSAAQLNAAVELRSKGKSVASFDDLLRTIDLGRPAAEGFDEMVAVCERIVRGDPERTHAPGQQ